MKTPDIDSCSESKRTTDVAKFLNSLDLIEIGENRKKTGDIWFKKRALLSEILCFIEKNGETFCEETRKAEIDKFILFDFIEINKNDREPPRVNRNDIEIQQLSSYLI